MKKWKKEAALVLAAALTASAVSGCKGSSDTAETTKAGETADSQNNSLDAAEKKMPESLISILGRSMFLRIS